MMMMQFLSNVTMMQARLNAFKTFTNDPGNLDHLYRTFYYIIKLYLEYYPTNASPKRLVGLHWLLARCLTFPRSMLTSDLTHEQLHVNNLIFLNKLADTFNEARMILRIFGSLNALASIMNAWKAYKTSRPLGTRIAFRRLLQFMQAASCILYYPLDNIYWLYSRGFRGLVSSDKQAELVSRISSQAWLFYILLDIVQLLEEKLLPQRPLLNQSHDIKESQEIKQLPEVRAKHPSAIELLADFRLIPLLCDALLAYRWSFDDTEWISSWTIAMAGSVSSLVGIYSRMKTLHEQ